MLFTYSFIMVKTIFSILSILFVIQLLFFSQGLNVFAIEEIKTKAGQGLDTISIDDIKKIIKKYTNPSQSSGSCEVKNMDNSNTNLKVCPTVKVHAKQLDTPLAKLTSAHHLYIIYTDENSNKFIFKGGPEKSDNKGFGQVITCYGKYESGSPCNDWPPDAKSVTVLQGKEITPLKLSCMKTVLENIDKKAVPYSPIIGPNSNSVVYTVLENCDISTKKPSVFAPGWGQDILKS